MPEIDYETKDAMSVWIEGMAKAYQIPVPIVGEDGHLKQTQEHKDAKIEDIPLDDVPLLDFDQEASSADQLQALENEISKLKDKKIQAYDLAGKLQKGPYWDKFSAARDTFVTQVDKLIPAHANLDAQNPDPKKVQQLERDIFDAYTLYGEAEKVARIANKSQDDILANLRSRSSKLSNEIDIQFNECSSLLQSDAKTETLQAAYTATQDSLLAMNTAINSTKIAEAEAAYDEAVTHSNDFTVAVRAAKRAGDAYQTEMLHKATIVGLEIQQAFGSRHAVEGSKKIVEVFDQQHESAKEALAAAQAYIENTSYAEANKALHTAAEHQSNMYSLILRGASSGGDYDDDGEEKEQHFSGSPEQKTLFNEAGRLKREAKRLYKQKEEVKASGKNAGSFERDYQSIMKLTKEALKDVVAKKLKEAGDKNKKATRQLHNMEQIAKEATSAKDIAADHIAELKAAAKPAYDALKELQHMASVNERYVNNYSSLANMVGQFNELISSAEDYQKSGYILNADEYLADAQALLKRMDFRARTFEEYTPEADRGELTERLRNKVAATRASYEKLAAHKDDFSDNQEFKIFDNFSQKAHDYLNNAETALDEAQTDRAADHLENTEVALDGMMTALDRGIATSAKANIFEADISAMRTRIAALYDRRKEILYEKQLTDFLNYNSIAGALADDAEALITAGALKDAQKTLSDLGVAMASMSACFIAPKGLTKGKKATPESYEKATAQPLEEDGTSAETIAEDFGTDSKAVAKLMQSVTKLRQRLGVAETSWRPECPPGTRPHFDQLHEQILEHLIDTETVLGTIDGNEAEVIQTAQTILTEALKFYADLQQLHKQAKAEATGEQQATSPETATRAIATLKEELDKLSHAISTSHINWAPKCLPEKKADLEKTQQQAIDAVLRGQELAAQNQLDPLGALPKIQQAVSDAKAGLSLMQKIFQASEDIKALKLKEYDEQAAQTQTDLEFYNSQRSQFDGWSINLADFDAAYSRGTTSLTAFKAAHLKSDLDQATAKLREAEECLANLKDALRQSDTAYANLKAEYSSYLPPLQNRQNALFKNRSALQAFPDQLTIFDDNLKLANQLIKDGVRIIRSGTQAEANAQLELISDTLDSLDAILKSNGDLGLEPIAEERSQPEETDRLTQLQQVLQSAYKQRPELEQIAYIEKNARELQRFDAAFEAAERYIELAETSDKPAEIEKAITKGTEQTQIMFSAVQAAKNNIDNRPVDTVATEDQLDETLTNNITDLMERIQEAQKLSPALKDAEYKTQYDGSLAQADTCAKDARIKISVPDFSATEKLLAEGTKHLQEADVTYSAALIANKELEDMSTEINSALKAIQTMSANETKLTSQKKLNDFIKFKGLALKHIGHAQEAIKAGQTKEARPDMPKIKAALDALKALFKSKREKAKEFFTGKKSKSTDKGIKGRRK